MQGLARQFGRPHGEGVLIDLPVAQGDLADLLCASRQRVNGALRRMQLLGIVTGGSGRMIVLRPMRLDEMAETQGLSPLDEANFVLSFVQSIDYSFDNVSAGTNEYWRFPL